MTTDVDIPDSHELSFLARTVGNLAAAEQLQLRAIQDVLQMASAATWERRAEASEFARPRPGDFNGGATEQELALRDARLAREAEACRNHARLLRGEVGNV